MVAENKNFSAKRFWFWQVNSYKTRTLNFTTFHGTCHDLDLNKISQNVPWEEGAGKHDRICLG